ncbi:DM13 domain-containing protein [Pseudomaricurvus alkylphenolicus]|jgi:hypothetical protein|uniref:DM13 domain-containing protein n=1 Tax=Pseudomaricurvus alkylphenolicus TaxID=1306991 RepID=UPI0014209741|nr:DM13 domain-containing protein [Pseudomaricurvus alkylphenolicus]NIB41561.1 DM13 domain-containing protein [Pseudomaricurvus alkylphenolicus]
MKMNWAVLGLTHIAAIAVGFAAGIYALPILIAPPAPSEGDIQAMSSQSVYSAQFTRELTGSDAFHWGEGKVSLGNDYITFMGELAPGPDYKLYLSPQFVETEAEFEHIKSSMLRIGDVKTFENFIVKVDSGTDLAAFNTVVVWCETFGEFITAAKYR